jgi:hypothetical protein
MTQTKISLPEDVMDGIKRDAERLGVTPGVLVRIKLCILYGNKDEAKPFIVTLENWREVEAYVQAKGLDLEKFMAGSVSAMMRRNALTAAQKSKADRILKK